MGEPTTDEVVNEAEQLAFECSSILRHMLAGRGPDLQGIVLMDLVATFFAGHHPAMREEAITLWLDAMRNLIVLNEEEVFPDGKPEGWAKQ